MEILSVFDAEFKKYGRVLEGLDVTELLSELEKTEKSDGVVYKPSEPEFEKLAVFDVIKNNVYGGMPIQIGYCNGTNTKLNCVEYHRDSEINIVLQDTVFLLGLQSDLDNYTLKTETIKAFKATAGSSVELFATALHYAPCDAKKGDGFRVAVVLPRSTNTDKPEIKPICEEDKLLFAKNKWLIAHKDTSEAENGAFVGLIGENIDIKDLI